MNRESNIFQISLVLHKPFTTTIKKIIDIPLLKDIVAVCDTMWMGQVFKSLSDSFFLIGPNFETGTSHSSNILPLRTADKRRHIFGSTWGTFAYKVEQDHANEGWGQNSKASNITRFTIVSSPSSQKSAVFVPR